MFCLSILQFETIADDTYDSQILDLIYDSLNCIIF
jgi:hypothetical protein